jgi:type II secretory pathway predicted ATPase ExeA
LVKTLREGRRPAALVGPPGLGKTLLLHLAGARLDDRLRSVYLPYAALPLDELCAWALSLLGFSQSDDTIGDLIQTASNLLARGSGLLLLIDDVSAMPLPTARKLGDLVAASRGALRLLVAAAEGPSASRMLAATGTNIHLVRLLEPMSEVETRRYVAARLARAGVPAAVAARFDDATLESIYRLSAGIPRRVHSVASAVLRGGAPESGADPLEAAEVPREAEGIAAGQPSLASPGPPAAREEAIRPAFESLGSVLAPRTYSRATGAPPARAVFATALVFGALCVGLPWLRSALAPPAPSVAAPRPADPVRRLAPAPGSFGQAGDAPDPAPPPAATTLSVQVNARPWANIEVDGVDLGPTPIAGIPLLAGRHRFRARMPDGRVLERVVDVSAENRFITFE